MKQTQLGKRLKSWNQLRVGETVLAYNPHAHPISREGGKGEIAPEQEMRVMVSDYYLGCFQRGALFPLEQETEEALFSQEISKTNPIKKSKGGEPSCP